MGWISKVAGVCVLGAAGYWTFDAHRAGLFELPELPDGAFTLSFHNGLRAIVLDADVPEGTETDGPRFFRALGVANRERKYLGVPFEVEPWFRGRWSWCKAPTDADRAQLNNTEELRERFKHARFEAVCHIRTDGNEIPSGVIFSVPRG